MSTIKEKIQKLVDHVEDMRFKDIDEALWIERNVYNALNLTTVMLFISTIRGQSRYSLFEIQRSNYAMDVKIKAKAVRKKSFGLFAYYTIKLDVTYPD